VIPKVETEQVISDLDDLLFHLDEIDQTIRAIADTVHGNCDRIAAEVANYRTVEDARHLRGRLQRLIMLHDDFLEPVIRIIDISGNFQAVTEQISVSCGRLANLSTADEPRVELEARRVRNEITWLRRSVIQRAEEAKRELGPLCEAAHLESRIAIGVNRALEAMRQKHPEQLELPRLLHIVEDRDSHLMADSVIENYLRIVNQMQDLPAPQLPDVLPSGLPMHWTARLLMDELDQIAEVDDLLTWLLARCEGVCADVAIDLLHTITESRPDRARPMSTSRRYQIEHFVVDAYGWRWRPNDGKQ
jgi:hypothetical protein